jgi:hypothetical protein
MGRITGDGGYFHRSLGFVPTEPESIGMLLDASRWPI